MNLSFKGDTLVHRKIQLFYPASKVFSDTKDTSIARNLRTQKKVYLMRGSEYKNNRSLYFAIYIDF